MGRFIIRDHATGKSLGTDNHVGLELIDQGS